MLAFLHTIPILKSCLLLTLKMPRKPASEMSSVYVICLIFLQTFQSYFCIQANNVDPDQTAPREQSDLGPHCLQK